MTSDEVPVLERSLISVLAGGGLGGGAAAGAVIAPLAALESVSHQVADAAGQQLGLSRRQMHVLVKRYRQGSGLVTDLVLGRSSGSRGAGRLEESVESVIEEVVRRKYLHRQKLTLAAVHREVVRNRIRDGGIGMLVGYMRVSKADGSQTLDQHRDALLAAGVDAEQLYEDRVSGRTDDRPGLVTCLKALRDGDTAAPTR